MDIDMCWVETARLTVVGTGVLWSEVLEDQGTD